MLRATLFILVLWLSACPAPDPLPLRPCTLTPAQLDEVFGHEHSVARVWDELALHAIRKDLPTPTVHARNLFHLSAAMYDAWAAYDSTAAGVFGTEKASAGALDAARQEAISFAAYRVLWHRYRYSAAGGEMGQCFNDAMKALGFDAENRSTSGQSPAALGNRIAAAIIASAARDGANEDAGYADTTGFVAENAPLVVAQPGNAMRRPDAWQPLQLAHGFSQNGINTGNGPQPYMGAHWGKVTPFAMGAHAYDAGTPPSVAAPAMRDWLIQVLRRQAQLEVNAEGIDLSPATAGDNPVGTNDGHGRALNPVTGQAYASNVVPLGDYGRVVAEFWADGPRSETPPGHWNVLANSVADSTGFARAWRGDSLKRLGALEWDVKVYLALNGGLHDAAIAAWGVKRAFTTSRPISLLRWYATNHGQASNPTAAGYDAQGLPLVPGLLEQVTDESKQTRHAAFNLGEWVVRGWRAEPDGGVGWVRLAAWVPYQRSTFVTPAFPAFVSGHSTFSRAGAEVLADVTGSDFFPRGLASFIAEPDQYLTFEKGPSVRVELQWATYFDAADQAGQSRLWGGIHLEPDDLVGRRLGQQVGREAVAKAHLYFAGTR